MVGGLGSGEGMGNMTSGRACLANELLKGDYKLSVFENRLLYILLAKLDQRYEVEREQHFCSDEYADFFGVDRYDFYTSLKEDLQNLFRGKLTFKTYDSEGNLYQVDASWLDLIAVCEEKRLFRAHWSASIMPYISKLGKNRPFTRLDLGIIRAFRSVYTFKLYELVMLKSHSGKFGHGIIDITLVDLYEQWQVPINMQSYRYFKRDIFIPAAKELEQEAGITLGYLEYKKDAKGIVHFEEEPTRWYINSETRQCRKVYSIKFNWSFGGLAEELRKESGDYYER